MSSSDNFQPGAAAVEVIDTHRQAMNEILKLISSARKIDRDLGARKLQYFLKQGIANAQLDTFKNEKLRIQDFILNVLGNSPDPNSVLSGLTAEASTSPSPTEWEVKHGCLLACYPLLDFAGANNEKAGSESEDANFVANVQLVTLKLLKEDPTRTVQLAAGNVLGHLSKIVGQGAYEKSRETIFQLITQNLREPDDETSLYQLQSPEAGFDIHLPASLIREKVAKDTLGWSSLEPSLKCLQLMIENLDSRFSQYVDQQLIDLLWACLSHRNRMCRETGFQILFSLIGSAPAVMKQHEQNLADHLKIGLTDNWNQVRLAAAVVTRKFLMTYEKEPSYPVLLPRLCLNRYYKSETVRVYSQESWKMLVGQEGRDLVAKYFAVIVDAYVEAAVSLNPAEREAACSCISELVQKIDKTVVLPSINRLLSILNTCAKDQTWSVRDAANLAFGNCAKYYPEEAKPFLINFYPKLFETLEDPMPLLRQGAASSLANIVLAYGSEAQCLVLDKIAQGLQNIEKNQSQATACKENTTSAPDSSSEIGSCNEATSASHIPACEHSVNSVPLPGGVQVITMETLTSLRLAKSGPATCPGCLISNTTQPWHLVDGCLYLIGALAELTPCKSELPPLIPLIARAASVKTYPEYYIILETVCKIIPAVAKSIGKKPFKEFLSILFEPIFAAIKSSNPVTSGTGKHVIRFLAEFIGPNILKSRIELYGPRYLDLIEECHIEELSLTPTST